MTLSLVAPPGPAALPGGSSRTSCSGLSGLGVLVSLVQRAAQMQAGLVVPLVPVFGKMAVPI